MPRTLKKKTSSSSKYKRFSHKKSNTKHTKKNKVKSRVRYSTSYLEHKEKITTLFLEMLNTIKLYHWKTKSYAVHKATDELQEELHKLIDQFVEVMLGKDESRLRHIHLSIQMEDFENVVDFKERIYKYRSFLTHLDDIFDKKDSDLLSIRDDMLAAINKFLYLLTLNE
jgi:hypothetical protein